MADVSGRALVMAIQAVDAQIARLEHEVSNPPPGSSSNDRLIALELLGAYEEAAVELQAAYVVARLGVSNLPDYGLLVRASSRPS